MSIKDINPAVGYRPLTEVPSDASATRKSDTSFIDAKARLQGSSAGQGTAALGVVSQFQRSDLEDPAKVDQMVRTSANELVSSHETGSMLSGTDKEKLVDFLSGDPAFRQRVEAYLRKVLV